MSLSMLALLTISPTECGDNISAVAWNTPYIFVHPLALYALELASYALELYGPTVNATSLRGGIIPTTNKLIPAHDFGSLCHKIVGLQSKVSSLPGIVIFTSADISYQESTIMQLVGKSCQLLPTADDVREKIFNAFPVPLTPVSISIAACTPLQLLVPNPKSGLEIQMRSSSSGVVAEVVLGPLAVVALAIEFVFAIAFAFASGFAFVFAIVSASPGRMFVQKRAQESTSTVQSPPIRLNSLLTM
mmetsp:Transcript_13689/g.16115  ORF Transcript_13689/g.16115 Transcript_13689/m.16115 type:complete len:246 (-) Transcript_13689:1671-2408(-)